MQRCACVGAEPNDIAGVRRNFGLIENDVEHGKDRSLWLRDYSTNTGNPDRLYDRLVALV
jgi:hypothetical protein